MNYSGTYSYFGKIWIRGIYVCVNAHDVCSVSKLSVFVRNIFSYSNMKKEQLNTVLLHGKNEGDNLFQSFYPSLLKMNVPIHINLCHSLQMALGARLMKRLAYWALPGISHFPSLLIHNCVIHRHSLHVDTTRSDSCPKKNIQYILNLFNKGVSKTYYMNLLPITGRRRDISY